MAKRKKPQNIELRDDLDQIVEYIFSEQEKPISNELQEYIDRIDFCDNLIRRFKTRKKVVNALRKKYSCTIQWAYKIIRDAEYVYGSTYTGDKNYWREILKEMALQTFESARRAGKISDQNASIRNLIQIIGLDRDDPERIDVSKLEQHNYIMGFIPDTLNVPLPENYEQRLEEMKQKKLKSIDNIQDAEIVE